jgi:hypothetical protein
MTYGTNSFNLDAKYVQSADDANSLMAWMISKTMKPRKSIGVKVFANPMIQLGDIVTIDYVDSDGVNQVSFADSRFVVYNITYERSSAGPSMEIYLSEVI